MSNFDMSMSDKIKGFRKLIVFTILFIIIASIGTFTYIYIGDYINWKSYDFFVKYIDSKNKNPHKDIVLLLIDENSLQYGHKIGLGRWPWSRNIYPEILNYLNLTDPPIGIFFDIFFFESDLGKGNDSYFSQGVAASGNVFQNMLLFHNPEREHSLPLPPDVIKNYTLNIESVENIHFTKNKENEYSVPLPCLRSDFPCDLPEDELKSVSPTVMGLNVASFNPDNDGVYRRGRILFNYRDYYFSSMALSAIMAYTSEKRVKILPGNVIQVGEYRIPVDSEGNYLVNYYKKQHRIPAYSMSALMLSAYYLEQGEVDKIIIRPDEFKDKIVIIGVSASAGQDLKNTPIDETMPGPEIQASIISNILQQNEIIQETRFITYIILCAVILICIASVLFINSNIIKVLVLIGIMLGYACVNIWLFTIYNYQSPIILILGAGLFSSAISFIYLSMTEGAEKRKYSKILGNMIDPHIVSEALKDLESLKRGGEKNITAFFSDIASFSTISEKLSSVDLAALLNEYLSAMTIILKDNCGTLDKYIGDAVVGIFGAPMENPDNAVQAAKASLRMIEKLSLLREKWTMDNAYCYEAQGMHVRIGLNTGMAKVGFMGTENLASYTMMGDTVNLAARLEAAAKDYGVAILVSEMTRESIYRHMILRKLDAVRVKGKSEPVFIYELIGENGEVPQNIVESTGLYEEALTLYTQRKWGEAINMFEQSMNVRCMPDKAVEMLIDRCRLYQGEPPPPDWDGVFTRVHK
ncbi:MAG: adenylate/guanylate cyclase domain-containing protein [Spirochaetota bacterium]|nr:adenylate/guanylate cyclase domain-containing protein [Spirochaetota bacterium]